MTIREYIEASTDEPVLLADGLDDALMGMTLENAVEFYAFNIHGAYVGEHTPIFIGHP